MFPGQNPARATWTPNLSANLKAGFRGTDHNIHRVLFSESHLPGFDLETSQHFL